MPLLVAVTRPDADPVTRDISSLLGEGFSVRGAAATRCVPLGGPLADPPTAFDPALESSYDWVVVTSKNTVAVLGADMLGRICRQARVAAVGPASAAAVKQAGVEVDWVGPGSARDLVAHWPPTLDMPDHPTVLVPCSALAKPTLKEGLEQAGCHVTQISVYTTEALSPLPALFSPDAPLAGQADGVDIVAVLAGSSLRAIEPFLASHPTTKLVAIGKPTAAVARSLGFKPHAVASEPTAAGLADAIKLCAATH